MQYLIYIGIIVLLAILAYVSYNNGYASGFSNGLKIGYLIGTSVVESVFQTRFPELETVLTKFYSEAKDAARIEEGL